AGQPVAVGGSPGGHGCPAGTPHARSRAPAAEGVAGRRVAERGFPVWLSEPEGSVGLPAGRLPAAGDDAATRARAASLGLSRAAHALASRAAAVPSGRFRAADNARDQGLERGGAAPVLGDDRVARII